MRMRHELKTWPEAFDAVAGGRKTWEIRLDDRGFKLGDTVVLCRYDPDLRGGQYTGERCQKRVGFMLRGPDFGIPSGFVIFTLEPIEGP